MIEQATIGRGFLGRGRQNDRRARHECGQHAQDRIRVVWSMGRPESFQGESRRRREASLRPEGIPAFDVPARHRQLMLANAMLMEQGLLSRCLVTWPPPPPAPAFIKRLTYPKSQRSRLTRRQFRRSSDESDAPRWNENELSPRQLHLSREAKAIWMAFHDAVERQLVDGAELAAVRGLANKAPEHAGRLAGILALWKAQRLAKFRPAGWRQDQACHSLSE